MNIGIDNRSPGMRLQLQVKVKTLIVRASVAAGLAIVALELGPLA